MEKYYSVNENFFLFPELKSIIQKTAGVQGLLEEALESLPGIEFAFIYGSYATGNETESSDVDVMIVGKPNLTELEKRISKLEDSLSREINYLCYKREEFEQRRKKGDPFISEVLAEIKIMIEGKEPAL